MRQQVDVLIVGGGLVGLALACGLSSSRVSVMVVDGQKAPAEGKTSPALRDGWQLNSGFDLRVSAVNPASKSYLERIGGWPRDRTCAFTGMVVRDSRGSGCIEFNADHRGEPALGYVVENRNILANLRSQADTCKNLELRWESPITSIDLVDGVYRVQLDEATKVECGLLVGADGGNSLVRKSCGLRGFEWEYDQQALVTTVMTEVPHQQMARQWFTRHGPLAFLPLASADQTLTSMIWSSSEADGLMAMDDESFCHRVTEASEGTLGEIIACDIRRTFPLRQQHVFKYVAPHLVLIGDAAHTIHPLAGQGLNLGLADAQALGLLINECRFSGRQPWSPQLLRQYRLARQPANILMGLVMEAFTRLYTPDQPTVNWLRNTGTRLLDTSPRLKSLLVRLASGR
ncbi:MAG: FAD-dependent monooxygenase [Pseudohongiellaceae bacterium]